MNSNKAPEKLYITNDEKRFGDKCHSASTEKYVDDDIEYICTDAFIEKACVWIDEMIWDYLELKHPNADTYFGVDMERFEEDFKNYMKGEYV